MEQIQELFEILKSTPEMALWGLLIWCLYILAKLASVVFAAKIVLQLFIKSWHEQKMKTLEIQNVEMRKVINKEYNITEAMKVELKEKEMLLNAKHDFASEVIKYFDKNSVNTVDKLRMIELFKSIKKKDSSYIHNSDLDDAIEMLKSKKK